MPVLYLLFVMFHLLKILRTLALPPLPLLMPTNLLLAHLPWLQQIHPSCPALLFRELRCPTLLQILLPHLTPLIVVLAVAVLKLRTPPCLPLLLRAVAGLWRALGGSLDDLESRHHTFVCHLISGLLKYKRSICKLLHLQVQLHQELGQRLLQLSEC